MSDLSIIENYDINGAYQGVAFNVINGEIQISDGLEALRQKIRNALSVWQNTWFLDINYGTDYNIAFRTPFPANLIPEIKNIVANIQGVNSISRFNFNFNGGIITINMTIIASNKNFGPINISTSISQ